MGKSSYFAEILILVILSHRLAYEKLNSQYNQLAMKKILFANIPFDGHFNPLTSIAMHLKSLGHDIRWYSGSIYQHKIEKLDIPYYPFVKAVDFNQHNVNEIFSERLKLDSQVSKLKYDIEHCFIRRSTEFYEDIKTINESWDFDLMISDIAFTGIPFIKDKLHKPVISIGVFPLTENSRDCPPAGLGLHPSYTFFGKIKQQFQRKMADQMIFKDLKKLYRNLFAQYGMESGTGNVFDVMGQKSDLLLQIGTPGFEYKRSDLSKNIRFIGALLPYAGTKKQTDHLGEILQKYQKVILVTQGTLEKDPEKIIVPTLEAFKDSNYLVIATTGGSKTQELTQRYPQQNIIIRDFIPFDEIMPHCDVYVTNGGYGGVMLGIENKLPLVVAGIHEGKNEINARVGYFKLGIDLKTEFPRPEQIKQSVEKVLSNSVYKINVKNLSQEFSSYNPQLLCEKYVNEVAGITQKMYASDPEYI